MNESATTFDTHQYVKHLTANGFSEQQAEALAEGQRRLLNDNLATKADIETLKQATKADIETLKQSTKADIETLKQSTKADIETLKQSTRADIAEAKFNLTMRIVLIVFAAATAQAVFIVNALT